MEIYRLNDKWNEIFEDKEEAIDYLLDYLGIELHKTDDKKLLHRQAELKEILFEVYFTVDEYESENEIEDDFNERIKEFREMQGF